MPDIPASSDTQQVYKELSDGHLEILAEHFKDSFLYQREYIKQRDRLFVYILITVTVLLFQLYSPLEAEVAITELISKQLEISAGIDISFLGSVTWFTLLGLTHRYYQNVVLVEQQYQYLHTLEDLISPTLGNDVFRREGKSYLANYPLFSEWSHILYQWIFPLILAFVASLKIIDEWLTEPSVTWTLSFNTAFFTMLLATTSLYLLRIHFKK